MKNMKVDIWSDVRCPFCYIGKHKFEKALEKFSNEAQIEVVWHSFELDPRLRTDPKTNTLDHLAESKGISRSQAEGMTQHAINAAREVGLELNFNKAVVANSFLAHQLIQLAKTKSLANEAEEALFKAHFSEGKNIDDKEVLLQIGASIGLGKEAVEDALSSDDFSYKVRQDQAEAQSLGIQGVPYFVFNGKYAVSGAQSTDVFLGALEKSWEEFEKGNKLVELNGGDVCSTDGDCD